MRGVLLLRLSNERFTERVDDRDDLEDELDRLEERLELEDRLEDRFELDERSEEDDRLLGGVDGRGAGLVVVLAGVATRGSDRVVRLVVVRGVDRLDDLEDRVDRLSFDLDSELRGAFGGVTGRVRRVRDFVSLSRRRSVLERSRDRSITGALRLGSARRGVALPKRGVAFPSLGTPARAPASRTRSSASLRSI